MIYEYRIYEAAPGRMNDLHARFRNHTLRIFQRHGIKQVGFFTPEIGGYTDQLIYILEFESMEHLEKAWKNFRNDPEWQSVKRETESAGPLVSRLISQILVPTDYSSLR